MNSQFSSPSLAKLVIRGVDCALPDAMTSLFQTRAERLLQLEPAVHQLEIEVIGEDRGSRRSFVAKGHIELDGFDLAAAVMSDDAAQAVDLLIVKLDRMLRRRALALAQSAHRSDATHRSEADAPLG
jgi:Ribosome-associated protein Y (PSrp-1)